MAMQLLCSVRRCLLPATSCLRSPKTTCAPDSVRQFGEILLHHVNGLQFCQISHLSRWAGSWLNSVTFWSLKIKKGLLSTKSILSFSPDSLAKLHPRHPTFGICYLILWFLPLSASRGSKWGCVGVFLFFFVVFFFSDRAREEGTRDSRRWSHSWPACERQPSGSKEKRVCLKNTRTCWSMAVEYEVDEFRQSPAPQRVFSRHNPDGRTVEWKHTCLFLVHKWRERIYTLMHELFQLLLFVVVVITGE